MPPLVTALPTWRNPSKVKPPSDVRGQHHWGCQGTLSAGTRTHLGCVRDMEQLHLSQQHHTDRRQRAHDHGFGAVAKPVRAIQHACKQVCTGCVTLKLQTQERGPARRPLVTARDMCWRSRASGMHGSSRLEDKSDDLRTVPHEGECIDGLRQRHQRQQRPRRRQRVEVRCEQPAAGRRQPRGRSGQTACGTWVRVQGEDSQRSTARRDRDNIPCMGMLASANVTHAAACSAAARRRLCTWSLKP